MRPLEEVWPGRGEMRRYTCNASRKPRTLTLPPFPRAPLFQHLLLKPPPHTQAPSLTMRNWALLCAFLLILPARSGDPTPKKVTLDAHGVDVVEVVDWALNTLTKKYPSQRLIQIVSASRSDIDAPPGATYFLTLELNRRGHIEVIVSVVVVVAVVAAVAVVAVRVCVLVHRVGGVLDMGLLGTRVPRVLVASDTLLGSCVRGSRVVSVPLSLPLSRTLTPHAAITRYLTPP